MTTYRYLQDPGHGWLEVPLAEVERLGVKPSSYSYTFLDLAYLEEDCDLPKFLGAKDERGEAYTLRELHTNHDSVIRTYRRFPVTQRGED